MNAGASLGLLQEECKVPSYAGTSLRLSEDGCQDHENARIFHFFLDFFLQLANSKGKSSSEDGCVAQI